MNFALVLAAIYPRGTFVFHWHRKPPASMKHMAEVTRRNIASDVTVALFYEHVDGGWYIAKMATSEATPVRNLDEMRNALWA